MRALVIAPVALGAYLVGYLHGYVVGEREGLDSDSDMESIPPTSPLVTNNTITGNTDSATSAHGVHVTGWRNGG